MSEPTVYPLKHPVELKNAKGEVTETLAELQLHRLRGKDLRALDNAKGQGSMTLQLIASSSRLPPSTIDQLDAEDVTEAGGIVAGFIGGALPTGAT